MNNINTINVINFHYELRNLYILNQFNKLNMSYKI